MRFEQRWWSTVAYTCIAAAAAGGFVAQTGSFFRGADWSGLAAFHDGPSLAPFDGTLSATSGIVFGAIAPVAGWSFWPYRVVAVTALALALVAIYRFTSRVAGPEVGLLAAAALATFTGAAPLLTQPFAMRIPLSMAMLVALVGLLDEGNHSRDGLARVRPAGPSRADLAAVTLLAAVLATSTVGLTAAAVVAMTLCAQRAELRRWALFTLPPTLWLAWFAWKGSLATEPWSWASRAHYVANLIARSFQHVACNSSTLAAVAATGFVALLWTDPTRRLSASWLPARWLFAAAVFATVTAYRNASVWIRPLGAHPPDTDSWVVAVFIVLATVESLRFRHRLLPETWRHACLGAFGVAIVLSSVTLAHAMETYRHADSPAHGLPVDTLAAVGSVAPLRDGSWTVTIDYGDIPAHEYQRIVSHLGSPLDYLGIATDESVEALRSRDSIVAAGLGIAAEPGDCQWSSAPASEVRVTGPARVIVASLDSIEPIQVFLARSAPLEIEAGPFAEVNPSESVILRFPGFDAGVAWTVRVSGLGVVGACFD